ncbi:MAG: NAD(P)/FAD-dependent oxidoreductase [Candidatus Diapherotrites archaeon]
MVKQEYDVIIVGGGPSGSSTAMFLKKNKVDNVLLIDKATFPRDKICGDAFSGKSMGIAKELGIIDEFKTVPNESVYGVLFSSPKGTQVEVPFPGCEGKQKTKPGFVVRRINGDNILFQRAKKQVDTLEDFTVTDLIWENDSVKGVKGKKKTGEELEIKAKIVVGADGATSTIGQKVKVDTNPPNHQVIATRAYYKGVTGMSNNIELHFVNEIMPGYFWIFPLDNGWVNVGVGLLVNEKNKRKLNLKETQEKIIRENPLFKERFANSQIDEQGIKVWTLPVASYHKKNHGNGWLLVGDAAALIDPFSGEGVGNAMTSGKFAAKYIARALKENDVSEANFAEYDKELWETIGSEIKTSYRLQRLGSIKFLLNMFIDKAVQKKEVKDIISGMLANEEAKKESISTFSLLKVLLS